MLRHITKRLARAKGKREQDDWIIEWCIQELERLETEAHKSGKSPSKLEIEDTIMRILPWLLVLKAMSLEDYLHMIKSILG